MPRLSPLLLLLLLVPTGCNDPADDDDDASGVSPSPELHAPVLELDASPVQFDPVVIDDHAMLSRTIANRGDATLTLTYQLDEVSGGTPVFEVTGPGGGTPPAELEPGASSTLEFHFAPVEAIEYTNTLSITTNDEDHPRVGIALSGAGQEPVVDEDQDGSSAEEDCDDTDDTVYPGADEVCDGVDNDCDLEVDEGVLDTFFPDGDLDGFGDGGQPASSCAPPAGYVENGDDCDDAHPDAHPDAIEACDSRDNDCDGATDEEGETPFYRDVDGDRHGDPEISQVGCNPPSGYVAAGDDCNDRNAQVYPGADEQCNGADDDCDTDIDEGATTAWYLDADRDGYGDDSPVEACKAPDGRYVTTSGDCDDLDPAAYPGASERCNGKDDDCDSQVDEGGIKTPFYADADQDGYGDPESSIQACTAPAGYVAGSSDCDDDDASSHPSAAEACDGRDNDCDTQVDEGVKTTFYTDADSDGYGVTGATTQACSIPSGYASQGGDCNDQAADVHPNAEEQCNSRDDDCDAQVDEGGSNEFYRDVDQDGHGDPLVTTQACTAPTGYVASSDDCNDRNAQVYPGASETCNGIDDDCDTQTDEGVTSTWYLDADRDGYGDDSAAVQACSSPGDRYATRGGDCDDLNPKVKPGATEVCNGIDDDCDGGNDEGFDADADGTSDCVDDDDDGFTENSGDCDDLNPATYPKAPEVNDGDDNDCDGRADQTTVVINFDTYPNGSAVTTGTSLQQQYDALGVSFRTDGSSISPPTVRTNSGIGFKQPTSGTNTLGSDANNSAGLVAFFDPSLFVTSVSIRDTDDDCTVKNLYAFDQYNTVVASMRSDGTCHAGGALPTISVKPVDSQGNPIAIVRVEFDTVAGPGGGAADGTYFTIDDFTFSYYVRSEEESRTRIVDFEFGANNAALGANTPLTSQYAAWGVTFGTDGTTTSPATIRSTSGTGFLRPSSGVNVLGSDSNNSAGIVMTFDAGIFVYRVSIRDTDNDSTVKNLYAFDANGNLITSARSDGTGDAKAPLPLIQVAPVDSTGKPVRIYKVEFDSGAGTAGGANDGTYFTLDDLSFSYFE